MEPSRSHSSQSRWGLLFAVPLCVGLAAASPALANQGGGDPSPVDYGGPVKKTAPVKTTASSQRTGLGAFLKRLFNIEDAAPGPATVSRRSARRFVPRETAPSGMPPEGEARFAGDQVIVRYQLNAPRSRMDALIRRLGNLRHLEARTFRLAGVTVHRYRILDGTPVGDVIEDLEADPTVVYAQPNYDYAGTQAAAAAAPNPQYALARLGIIDAHALATGEGVPVAVIDSQIDGAHPEFAGTQIEMLDATGEDAGDADAHGTSIAGVIAAQGTLTGIAPKVRLVGIRAFLPNADGSARSTTWRIASALDAAWRAQARVVNMSFAGPEDPLVGDAIAGVARRGMIGIAAAGNDGPGARPLYPAAYPGVIAVTAVDKDDLVYDHANRGDYIALAAPGVDILAPVPGNGYNITSGTSLAAAHVSGLAALLLSRAPGLTADDVAGILSSSAADLGEPGLDAVFGAGLPDAVTVLNGGTKKILN
ncbi:MAG: S8 family serine peptidase [Rhizobiaceae bacterium]